MPIKPENLHRYAPKKERAAIRAEVLERAGNRCEWEENGERCNLEHGATGLRDLNGKWWPWESFAEGEVPEEALFEKDGQEPRKAYAIILTIAHLDHTPENNGEPGNRPNLRAWCQYHHLAYDRPQHLENSRKTRLNKKGQVGFLETMEGPISHAP